MKLAGFAFLLSILLLGCGGAEPESGVGVAYGVTPSKATVATGGSVDLATDVVETGYTDLTATVREGSAGGSVVKTATGNRWLDGNALADGATYTAPGTPGTYHVDIRFLAGSTVEAKRTATITVDVAP